MKKRNLQGNFVPQTEVWDPSEVYDADVTKRDELTELLVRMYLNLNRMALSLNLKDNGQYDVIQNVNSQTYFPNPSYTSLTATTPTWRQVLRKVYNINPPTTLPNTGTLTIPHGIEITTMTTFTRIYGVASDTVGFNYIPLPYASPVLANNIELRLDVTNIYITTGSNRTNFNITYVVVEFIQN